MPNIRVLRAASKPLLWQGCVSSGDTTALGTKAMHAIITVNNTRGWDGAELYSPMCMQEDYEGTAQA